MVKRAVLFANGSLSSLAGLKLKKNDFLIGIDGGSRLIAGLGRRPNLVVGDFDSFPRPSRRALFKRSQDKTDTEFALDYCVKSGFKEIVLAGVLGDRLDHLIANIFLGVRFNLTIIEGRQTLYFVPTKTVFVGKPGDLVSLIPLSDCFKINTIGLKWRLRGESLKVGSSRGISNVMTGKTAKVELKGGLLLVVHLSNDLNTQTSS